MKRINWGVVGFLFELCALILWVGGLIVIIALVIPAVFNSFGMEAAGRFLRRVFDGFGLMNVWILILLSVVAGIRFRAFGHNPSEMFAVSSVEWWLLAGMGIMTFTILVVLGPQAISLQEEAFEAVSKEDKDIAYAKFFRLHMIVRACHLVNFGLAASLLIAKVRKALFHRSMALR
ncbi:MAG: hypothetical protein NPIRA03_02900 [Nitrospirales bacterium]|nr:MAG: hypothetical protein NPIRA03_02900 [Nitrospirales bacterium]